jgi:hypothetical protein
MLFTNEHNAIRATIAQFIDKEINPYVDESEVEQTVIDHFYLAVAQYKLALILKCIVNKEKINFVFFLFA